VTRLFPPLARLTAPNLITSASVVSGTAGILLAGSGNVRGALTCGLLAIPLDLLDGWVARRLGLTSDFGAALDSLADATSFCLLPAAVLATVCDKPAGWAAALGYALCGLWRLAHFHEAGLIQFRGREAFVGMPTPYAAALFCLAAVSAVVWPGGWAERGLPLTAICLGLMMIAGAPFPKGGWHYRLMWVLLPAAMLALWRT
jgi:CDP-diacylglycerol--serine O-phosphatidyltransferase